MHNLSDDFIERWKHILNEVDMSDVPIEYMSHLELFFNNGQPPTLIDVIPLLEIHPSWKLEHTINETLENMDDIIDHVDFHLNFEKVVETVDKATQEALKDL